MKNRCWKLQGQKWKSEKLYLKLFQMNLSQCGCGGPHLESIQSCWRRKLWRRGDSSQSRCTSPRDSSKAFQEIIKVVKRGRRTFSIVLVSYSLSEELQEPGPTSFSTKCSQTQGSFPIISNDTKCWSLFSIFLHSVSVFVREASHQELDITNFTNLRPNGDLRNCVFLKMLHFFGQFVIKMLNSG